jgi:hypothetical protein
MASSVFPVATSSFNAVVPYSITATAPFTLYGGSYAAAAGTYTVTCTASTITKIYFFLGNTLVTTASTSSGTVTVNLATPADRVRLFTDTGTSILVTITQTGNAVVSNISGVLDTLTGSGTYTTTSTSGLAYAILIGGGGGGGGLNNILNGAASAGGGAGGISEKLIELTGNLPYVVAGSVARQITNTASTFAGMTANGGSGSIQGGNFGAGGTATGGDFNTTGASGANSVSSNGGTGGVRVAPPNFKFVNNSAGTGGTGGPYAGGAGSAGTAGALGNGGGGGGEAGGGNNNGSGGAGGAGVLYVLRF